MLNEHVFKILVSLNQKSKPLLILRLGERACVSGINNISTVWDNQCTYACMHIHIPWFIDCLGRVNHFDVHICLGVSPFVEPQTGLNRWCFRYFYSINILLLSQNNHWFVAQTYHLNQTNNQYSLAFQNTVNNIKIRCIDLRHNIIQLLSNLPCLEYQYTAAPKFFSWNRLVQCFGVRINKIQSGIDYGLFPAPPNVQTQLNNVMDLKLLKVLNVWPTTTFRLMHEQPTNCLCPIYLH
jgi:hypothetical protein